MAHFLGLDRLDRPRCIGKPWAMVTVRLVARKRLQIQEGSIAVAKNDAEWCRLPDDMEVVDQDGELVLPSDGRQFFVTVDTINPLHGLTEINPCDMR